MSAALFDFVSAELARNSSDDTGSGLRSQEDLATSIAANRLWCERLANMYELEAAQLDDLKQLVNLCGALDGGLVKVLLWHQTTLYRILNKQLQNAATFARFSHLLTEVENHLPTSWNVPDALKITARVHARDLLVDYAQPCYATMHLDVVAYLRVHQERLELRDVFDNPAREATFISYVKKMVSNARTSLREILILSVAGKTKKALEDTTWEIMSKFKKGGATADLRIEHQIRFALVRRWTYEEFFGSQGAVAQDSSDGTDTEYPPSLMSAAPAGAGPEVSKKRKLDDAGHALKPTVGKVVKGEDFWSKIDRRLEAAITAWGERITSPEWREYIDHTVELDRRLFGRSTSGVLSPIPTQVVIVSSPLVPQQVAATDSSTLTTDQSAQPPTPSLFNTGSPISGLSSNLTLSQTTTPSMQNTQASSSSSGSIWS